MLSEHIGFAVWTVWSVLVLFTPEPLYSLTPADKFLLTSTPALVGSLLRIPYTFAVARFGGRTWTVVSALLLLVPTVVVAAVLEPACHSGPCWSSRCFAGVGGSNFAFSTANINTCYPDREKGWALGLNAGGGNAGVAAVQLVGLLVLAVWG
nr:MFS transporter [Geodermatophilaceae bacterium]